MTTKSLFRLGITSIVFFISSQAITMEQAVDWSKIKWTSASVLLHYTDDNGIKKVILAEEAGGSDINTFCDFGGKREKEEMDPLQTAGHELFEEAILAQTIGWTLEQTRDFLQTDNTDIISVYSRPNWGHVAYITNFTPYRNFLFKNFRSARKNAKLGRYREKKRLAIVTWQNLEKAVIDGNNMVEALVQDPNTGKFNKDIIPLRPSFTTGLRPYFLDECPQKGSHEKIQIYKIGRK